MKKSFYLMLIAALAMTFANVSFADDAKDEASDAPKVENAEPVFNANVPEDGSVEEYFAFIKNVQSRKNLMAKPTPTNQRDFILRVISVLKACNEATNKILAKDSLTKGQIADAVKAKIEIIQQLASIDASYQKEFPGLIKLCKENGLDSLAEALEEKLEIQEFVDDFMRALQTGKTDKAKKVLSSVIEKAEKKGKKISPDFADGLGFILQFAKEIYEKDQANEIYTKVIDLYINADNTAVVWQGRGLRREMLPGNEMLIGGTFIDGSEYKAEDYAGKTVLIDFWATWCGPCRGEIPNVKKLYGYYHEKGFEIIGISSDRDVETLKKFIEKEEMPWNQMMRDNAVVADGQPMGTYYGVTGIPTMILIGPDGKVVTVNARGPALKKALEEIYGPMPKDEEADDEDEE